MMPAAQDFPITCRSDISARLRCCDQWSTPRCACFRRICLATAVFCAWLSAAAFGADEQVTDSGRVGFSWTRQRTSAADLVIARSLPFRHGTVDLIPEEQDAYIDLLRTIRERQFLVSTDPEVDSSAKAKNVWESAFYQYEHIRRQAFANGAIRLTGSGTAASGSTAYSVLRDMTQHPGDFVGRPVVLRGIFHPSGAVELTSEARFDFEQELYQFQRGVLRSFSGGEPLAIVDAAGYYNQNSQIDPRPFLSAEYEVAVPVLVKGWFVKLWGQRPLIYTEGIRLLEPEPYGQLIREFAVDRQTVTEPEQWLFYETLTHMQLANADLQRRTAAVRRQQRVTDLKDEVLLRQTLQLKQLNQDIERGVIDSTEAASRRRRLERQVAARLERYASIQSDPTSFPMFVDLFQNPEHWQGELVTLTGHVRHSVSYDGDAALFQGRRLHELWLFTDDSQHNPAVIITPELPEGFPLTAEVIDRVTVTGCFVKMYVYRGQEHHRLAPLILSGSVTWEPTDDQILALAEAGAIPPNDPRVRAVRGGTSDSTGDAAVLLSGFAAIVVMMTIWGRVQRDRRERRRLLDLVEEQPDFRGNNVIG